jgi:hypothetical protein
VYRQVGGFALTAEDRWLLQADSMPGDPSGLGAE